MQTILVIDFEAMLARLPAVARSRVSWTLKPLRDALRHLQEEPLTEAVVDAATEAAQESILALRAEVLWMCGDDFDAVRAAVQSDFKATAERLAAFLPSDESRDTLAWLLSLIVTISDMVFSMMTPEMVKNTSITDSDKAQASPFVRGILALMAANEAARNEGDPARADELVDFAFLEVMKARDVLRDEGYAASSHPHETEEERQQRLHVVVKQLRESLSPSDWAVLDAARMGDLR